MKNLFLYFGHTAFVLIVGGIIGGIIATVIRYMENTNPHLALWFMSTAVAGPGLAIVLTIGGILISIGGSTVSEPNHAFRTTLYGMGSIASMAALGLMTPGQAYENLIGMVSLITYFLSSSATAHCAIQAQIKT
jgi:hypothetical protein